MYASLQENLLAVRDGTRDIYIERITSEMQKSMHYLSEFIDALMSFGFINCVAWKPGGAKNFG